MNFNFSSAYIYIISTHELYICPCFLHSRYFTLNPVHVSLTPSGVCCQKQFISGKFISKNEFVIAVIKCKNEKIKQFFNIFIYIGYSFRGRSSKANWKSVMAMLSFGLFYSR